MSIKTDNTGNRYVDVDLTTDIQKKIDVADTVNERREIVFNHVLDVLRHKRPTAKDGRTVEITRGSAKKLVHNAPDIRIRVIPEVENIINAGTLINIKDVAHRRFKSFAYYGVRLKVRGDFYNAVVNIGIRENGDSVLYTINPIVKGADWHGFGDDKGAVSTKPNTAPENTAALKPPSPYAGYSPTGTERRHIHPRFEDKSGDGA